MWVVNGGRFVHYLWDLFSSAAAVGDAPLNSSDTRTVVSQCSNSLIFGTLKEGGV